MVNTVASSDAPPIVNAVKAAGGYVVIWWNKPDNLEPWSVGNNFVAFQKHSGVESGQCNGKSIGEALGRQGGGVIMLPGVQDSTTSQTRVAGLQGRAEGLPERQGPRGAPGELGPAEGLPGDPDDAGQVRRPGQGHLGGRRRDDARRDRGREAGEPPRHQVRLRRPVPADDRLHEAGRARSSARPSTAATWRPRSASTPPTRPRRAPSTSRSCRRSSGTASSSSAASRRRRSTSTPSTTRTSRAGSTR